MERRASQAVGRVAALLVLLALAAHASAQPGTVFVVRAPALEATPLQESVPLRAGERGEAAFLVRNVGNVTARFVVDAAELPPLFGERSLGVLVTPTLGELGPNESLVVTVHLFAFTDEAARSNLAIEVTGEGGLPLARALTPVHVSAEAPPPEGDAPPPTREPLLAAAAVAAAGAGGLWAWRRREAWRYLLALGLVPLYTRLAPSRLLDQEKRDALHRLIAQEPGIHYSELRRRTGLPSGVVVHHLRTLERHRLVVSRRDGPLRRYAAPHAPFPPAAPPPVTPMQRRVLDLLRGAPLTQRQIAESLGVSQQGANRHVKALERRGLLAIRFEEGEWRCHALEPTDRA